VARSATGNSFAVISNGNKMGEGIAEATICFLARTPEAGLGRSLLGPVFRLLHCLFSLPFHLQLPLLVKTLSVQTIAVSHTTLLS
jgi:hypothetical protein